MKSESLNGQKLFEKIIQWRSTENNWTIEFEKLDRYFFNILFFLAFKCQFLIHVTRQSREGDKNFQKKSSSKALYVWVTKLVFALFATTSSYSSKKQWQKLCISIRKFSHYNALSLMQIVQWKEIIAIHERSCIPDFVESIPSKLSYLFIGNRWRIYDNVYSVWTVLCPCCIFVTLKEDMRIWNWLNAVMKVSASITACPIKPFFNDNILEMIKLLFFISMILKYTKNH